MGSTRMNTSWRVHIVSINTIKIQINANGQKTKPQLNKLYAMSSKDVYNESVSMIFIEDTLHIIGGSKNNKHYIFKPKLQRFKQIHVFKEYSNGFSSHSVIYIKSQN